MANMRGIPETYSTDSGGGLHLSDTLRVGNDKMVTWLQYPIDYAGEQPYCQEPSVGSYLSSFGMSTEAGNRIHRVATETRTGKPTRLGIAKDAEASAAYTTSSNIHFEGREAFIDVKTAMQPALIQPTHSPEKRSHEFPAYSSTPLKEKERAPCILSSSSQTLADSDMLARSNTVHPGTGNWPRNPRLSDFCLLTASEGLQRTEASGEKVSEASTSFHGKSRLSATEDIRSNSDTGIAHVHGNRSFLVAEDHLKNHLFPASNSDHHEAYPTAASDFAHSNKFSSLSDAKLTQDGIRDASSNFAAPSYSESSETSAGMSTKGASSMGKRTVAEHDCQLKNAEVNSHEVRQLSKRPSKRNRVAESHNLSEKRRRNRINEKLKTLQELIPNSSKTDKASILDEALEYLKTLQSQLQIMIMRSGIRLTPMVVSPGLQHFQGFQISPEHPMGIGLPLMHGYSGMGIGMCLPPESGGKSLNVFQSVPSHLNDAKIPVTSQFTQPCLAGIESPSLQKATGQTNLWTVRC
ncbi:hypothetical protein KP509_33G061700 [Ceratopteris richardii]|uniref:BHLH domain-containing protein n=1 Tax=Ceratopteris richardii TaxID=49495 RepID=A0A8T2QS81_CERRI|nr:hypothetical protein KP509_33G061700 [Ceratopteris richardii]